MAVYMSNFFLFGELLVFWNLSKVLTDNSGVGKVIFFQFLWIVCCIGMSWQFIKQRYTRFFEDGISYIAFFKREFTKWSEITEVKFIDNSYQLTIELKSGSKKIRLLSSEYKKAVRLKEFLIEKLEENKNTVFFANLN